MATLTSKLIIELLDRASGPAKRISATINRLQAASRANAAHMEEMRGRVMGAVGAGYALGRALAAPIRAGAHFQTMLEDIRQKAGVSGDELTTLGHQLQKIAAATNQLPSTTIDTFDGLLGLGLGGKTDAENVDAALKMMPAINKVATAYRAATDDVMRAGQAVFSNLKVPANEVITAFDSMARAGKDGAFELKDMSKYFPELTTVLGTLGVRGVKGVADLGAALQVVRQGAGDSATAANNLKNLLLKIGSAETQRKFKKLGVNFRKEMDRAKEAGVSPIEAVTRLTERVLKKHKGATIADLFEDQQAQLALQALLADMPRYRAIRAAALKASGEVEKDFAERVKTADAAMIRFKGSIENLNIELSNGLLPALTAVIDRGLVPVLRAAKDFAQANPMLATTLIGVTAGLIGLRIAATAAQFAFLWMKGGALLAGIAGMKALRGPVKIASLAMWPLTGSLRAARRGMVGFAAASAVLGTGGALRMAGTAMAGMLNPMRLLSAALRVLRVAMLGIPGVAVLTALGAAGTWIYKNWSGIKEMFSGIWEGLTDQLPGIQPLVQPLIDLFGWLSDKISGVLGPLDKSNESWRAMGVVIGETIGGAINSVIERIKTFIGWIRDAAKAVGSFLGGGGLKTPLIGGGAKAPFISGSVAGTRAGGGPVRRGSTYLVGEQGPELWRAPASGSITNTMDTVRAIKAQALAGAASARGGAVTNVGGVTIHVQAVAGQSPQAIADAVERRMSEKLNALSRGAFSDGAN